MKYINLNALCSKSNLKKNELAHTAAKNIKRILNLI
jgi:hypothetical protein